MPWRRKSGWKECDERINFMAKGSGKKNDAVEKAGNKSPTGRRVASATPRTKAGTRKGQLSVGEIASQFDVSVSQVQYVIRSRALVAVQIVGNLRFFAPATVRQIGQQLAAIVKDRAFRSGRLPEMRFAAAPGSGKRLGRPGVGAGEC